MAVLRNNRKATTAPLPVYLAEPDHGSWVPPAALGTEPEYQAYQAFCTYTDALCAWHGVTAHVVDKYLPPGADILDFLAALKTT